MPTFKYGGRPLMFFLSVVQGNHLRSMAWWIQQSIRKMLAANTVASARKLRLAHRWFFPAGQRTPNVHWNTQKRWCEKRHPCSATAISVSGHKSHQKTCGLNWTGQSKNANPRLLTILKSSAWRNGQKSLQICSLTFSKIIQKAHSCHLCQGCFSQSIKPGCLDVCSDWVICNSQQGVAPSTVETGAVFSPCLVHVQRGCMEEQRCHFDPNKKSICTPKTDWCNYLRSGPHLPTVIPCTQVKTVSQISLEHL